MYTKKYDSGWVSLPIVPALSYCCRAYLIAGEKQHLPMVSLVSRCLSVVLCVTISFPVLAVARPARHTEPARHAQGETLLHHSNWCARYIILLFFWFSFRGRKGSLEKGKRCAWRAVTYGTGLFLIGKLHSGDYIGRREGRALVLLILNIFWDFIFLCWAT